MGDLLLRGLSSQVKREIKKMAIQEQLSMNQATLQLILWALKKKTEEEEQRKEQGAVMERIRELREEIYKKYGMMDDSTKIIRKMRDSRYR